MIQKLLLSLFMFIFMVSAAKTEEKPLNVAILVYEGVYLLDFAGPMEVFNDANLVSKPLFNVFTVSVSSSAIKAHTGLNFTSEYTIDNCPKPDILVVPGGSLNISENDPKLKDWIISTAKDAKIVMSVCTGAFTLARLGLLDGKEATTWHGALAGLKKISDKIIVKSGVRYTDNGSLLTTAGISAGIDGSLYLVGKLFGKETADKTAKYMDYEYWDGKSLSK